MKKCSFTGHRPSSFAFGYSEYHSGFFKLYSNLDSVIEKLCSDGYDTFYSGMAEGVDLWAADILLQKKKTNKKIRLVAVIPFEGHINSVREQYKKRYEEILRYADEIIYTSKSYSKSCYRIRNEYLVDKADLLVAVYYESEPKSGTGQTVRYAQKNNKEVLFINPDSLYTD